MADSREFRQMDILNNLLGGREPVVPVVRKYEPPNYFRNSLVYTNPFSPQSIDARNRNHTMNSNALKVRRNGVKSDVARDAVTVRLGPILPGVDIRGLLNDHYTAQEIQKLGKSANTIYRVIGDALSDLKTSTGSPSAMLSDEQIMDILDVIVSTADLRHLGKLIKTGNLSLKEISEVEKEINAKTDSIDRTLADLHSEGLSNARDLKDLVRKQGMRSSALESGILATVAELADIEVDPSQIIEALDEYDPEAFESEASASAAYRAAADAEIEASRAKIASAATSTAAERKALAGEADLKTAEAAATNAAHNLRDEETKLEAARTKYENAIAAYDEAVREAQERTVGYSMIMSNLTQLIIDRGEAEAKRIIADLEQEITDATVRERTAAENAKLAYNAAMAAYEPVRAAYEAAVADYEKAEQLRDLAASEHAASAAELKGAEALEASATADRAARDAAHMAAASRKAKTERAEEIARGDIKRYLKRLPPAMAKKPARAPGSKSKPAARSLAPELEPWSEEEEEKLRGAEEEEEKLRGAEEGELEMAAASAAPAVVEKSFGGPPSPTARLSAPASSSSSAARLAVPADVLLGIKKLSGKPAADVLGQTYAIIRRIPGSIDNSSRLNTKDAPAVIRALESYSKSIETALRDPSTAAKARDNWSSADVDVVLDNALELVRSKVPAGRSLTAADEQKVSDAIGRIRSAIERLDTSGEGRRHKSHSKSRSKSRSKSCKSSNTLKCSAPLKSKKIKIEPIKSVDKSQTEELPAYASALRVGGRGSKIQF